MSTSMSHMVGLCAGPKFGWGWHASPTWATKSWTALPRFVLLNDNASNSFLFPTNIGAVTKIYGSMELL
jgi:hypothetical protein